MSVTEPRCGEALEAGVAAVPHGLVEVVGADRIAFLQSVLTQDITGMRANEVRSALLLDGHGRLQATMDVIRLEDLVLLLTPTPDLGAGVTQFLGARTFLADVRLVPVESDAASLRGLRARDVAAKAGLEVPAGAARRLDDALLVGREDGIDIVVGEPVLDALVARLIEAGATRVDDEALEAWRIARGVPAWDRELVAPHLPEEAGVLATHVHLDKGCYPGQEAVARMWMLGRPRRGLASVRLEGAATAGWSSGHGRMRVEVTSAASYAGERVGLAYVPPDASEGDRLGDDDGAVVVRGIVGAELDVPGRDPAVVRRRDRGRPNVQGQGDHRPTEG